MKRGRRILAVFLMMVVLSVILCGGICPGMILTVSATEMAEEGDEGLTEQEKAEKAEQELQQQVYAMPVESNGWENWPQGPGTYGEAAIVMEVGTGAILYAKNIDDHHYPASITKVLTALVALENGQLTDTVTFSHDSVAFLQPGDSSVGLKEGNIISLDQALHATLLASANEAAYAVGESVGINAGYDYNWFLEQMNTRCKELGGENSNFVNTNGLHDPNHYTCARDMALIGRELFKYPEFFSIVQTLNYEISESETTEQHVFQQKHKMLIPGNSNYYEYAIGGKTGYTSDALSTLITMADNGNLQLVCVVLRTHGANIYPDTRNLFDYAFANFQKISVEENETSEDVDECSGYVVVPNGVEFTDLDMEIIPDGGTSTEATLEYRYDDQVVGSARAVLSQSYLAEHAQKVQDVKELRAQTKEKSEDNEKNLWEKLVEKFGKKSLTEKIIILVASILLLVLIAVFLRTMIVRKRK
ncbi:D-alanyl-D-alanine carboxypeptidase family protein [Faecalicatena contorta]|uniref:D-alanyl-D-alanine carboxypeptidase family protein n=1 Tax=Faecalicatena contorta TaxID=39482 RepID=UPI001F1CC325|nr:D-alanyl-D-alanine carboxypeptidase family protein [Faecalicatena contorta]MCF2667968.1 D-alanyl-D-alanine carboxypeptidase [Faecalicatena contorta]